MGNVDQPRNRACPLIRRAGVHGALLGRWSVFRGWKPSVSPMASAAPSCLRCARNCAALAEMRAGWKARLGEDHLVRLDALADISDTALTRETAIEVADGGLSTTFVRGRNLVFFCFAGALAYRRGSRHIVAGMCETDYSGYPDCRRRYHQGHVGCAGSRHGPALRHPYVFDVDRQGGDFCYGGGDRRQSAVQTRCLGDP
jgi:hypothetical protein